MTLDYMKIFQISNIDIYIYNIWDYELSQSN